MSRFLKCEEDDCEENGAASGGENRKVEREEFLDEVGRKHCLFYIIPPAGNCVVEGERGTYRNDQGKPCSKGILRWAVKL